MGAGSDLVSYFRELVNQHVKLSGNFHRLNVEELLGGKPKGVSAYPYLSLERAEFSFRNQSGVLQKKRTIAFCVVDQKGRTATEEDEQGLLDGCEDIVDDIIRRVRQHVQEGFSTSIAAIDLDTISAVQLPFSGTTGEVGFRVVFDVTQKFNSDTNNQNWI